MKVTPKTYVVRNLKYRTNWNKDEVGVILAKSRFTDNYVGYTDEFGCVCLIDDFDKVRDEMFLKVQNKLQLAFEKAQQDLQTLYAKGEEHGY